MSVANPSTLRDFFLNVGFGRVGGFRRISALGNVPDVDTDTVPEDIWTGGGIYPWLTVASTLEIVSDSANDAAAGTGARTVRVFGLDANYVEHTELVTLNGVAAVALTNSYFRINGAIIASAGSGKVNAGNLTIRDSGGGTTRAILQAGYGLSRQSQYTVPAGHTLMVISLLACINRQAQSNDVTVGTFTQSSTGFYFIGTEVDIGAQPYRHDAIPGIVLTEKTDFCLRVTSTRFSNADVTGSWLGILADNTKL